MDQHDIRVRRALLQAVPDGILPFLAARDDAPRRELFPLIRCHEHGTDIFFFPCAGDDDELADVRDAGELPERPHEDRLAAKREEHLVFPGMHTPSLPGGGKNRTDHQLTLSVSRKSCGPLPSGARS